MDIFTTAIVEFQGEAAYFVHMNRTMAAIQQRNWARYNVNENHYQSRWGLHIIQGEKRQSLFMRLRRYGIGVLVSLSVLLSLMACSSSSDKPAGQGYNAVAAMESSHSEESWDAIEPIEIKDLPTGAAAMIQAVKDYKQAVESEEQESAAALAREIVGLWKAMEAKVKTMDRVLHQELTSDIVLLLAETSTKPWDRDRLIQLDYKLYQSFRDVKQKIQHS